MQINHSHTGILLSPVLVFTSDPSSTILILLFPPFVIPLFQFNSSLLFCPDPPPPPKLHAPPVSSKPALLPNLQIWSALIPPYSPNLLYLNPVYPSIKGNLIIVLSMFYCVYLSSLASNLSVLPDFSLTSSPPTSLWPPSNYGLQQLFQNYRTYPHIIWVGTTHKLKPSPTCYPLPIIS